MSDLKKTPLYDIHKARGGRLIDFGGWAMPVMYQSVLAEHHAVRGSCGLFDTSHMGEVFLEGEGTLAFLDALLPAPVSHVHDGQAIYSPLLYENGTFVDDLIAYRRHEKSWMLVVNASNIAKDVSWIRDQAAILGYHGEIHDHSDRFGMIAVQGPHAPAVIDSIFPGLYEKLGRPFRFAEAPYHGAPAFVSRTGYTGEAGVEVVLSSAHLVELWKALEAAGGKPAGLGARDSLRLEKGYSLYGHEIDETTDCVEAGLSWTVDWKKPRFLGREAIHRVKEQGPKRKLVGLVFSDRGALARAGADVYDVSGTALGKVTSGTYSPSLSENIALAYVPAHYSGATAQIELRGNRFTGRVTGRVFFK